MTIETKYFVDSSGIYIGGFCGAEPPEGSIEVPNAPAHAIDEIWNGSDWVERQKSIEELRPEYEQEVQKHLDSVARQRGYDNVLTACSYAGAPNPFQAESLQFVSWRGEVWKAAFDMFNEVAAGEIPLPTKEQAIANLPEFPIS